jgi:hypothetical protein
MNRSLCLLSVTALLTAAAVGCSDQYAGRYAVSGKVTLAGQPLDQGTILFEPLDGQDTSSGSPIKDGQYRMERQGGLKPGKYRVKITSGDGKTPASDEEAAAPGGSTNIVSVDRIPAEWNTTSEKQVEVKSDGDNKFDFDIPTAVDTTKKDPRKKKR